VSDLLKREADYLNADPAVTAWLKVLPHVRRSSGNVKRCHLWREGIVESRLDLATKMREHQLVITITWPITSGSKKAEDVQADLDTAIEALLHRIAGPHGDKTHDGRFLSVVEMAADPRIVVAVGDPHQALAQPPDQAQGREQPALAATIRYPVLETVDG
jgi:hypothetical protein